MLKPAFDFAKQALSLTKDVQQNKSDIKQLQEDLKEVRQEIHRLVVAVQALTFRLQQNEENASRDREILLLRLENEFLKFERGLPPKDPGA